MYLLADSSSGINMCDAITAAYMLCHFHYRLSDNDAMQSQIISRPTHTGHNEYHDRRMQDPVNIPADACESQLTSRPTHARPGECSERHMPDPVNIPTDACETQWISRQTHARPSEYPDRRMRDPVNIPTDAWETQGIFRPTHARPSEYPDPRMGDPGNIPTDAQMSLEMWPGYFSWINNTLQLVFSEPDVRAGLLKSAFLFVISFHFTCLRNAV